MTLRLGLSSGALYPRTLTEDAPALAAAWGVRDLEFMLQTHGEYDPAFMATVARNAKAAGVRVHSLHTGLFHPVLDPYPRRIEEGRALFGKAVEAAHRLGAKAIVWHGATRAEAEEPEGWARFLERAADFAHMCHEAGVALAVENVSWCVLASVRDVTAFAKEIPNLAPPGSLGFVFDPFQASEAGANHFMLLAAMAGKLVDVHLSDYREGMRHLPPGQGELPWSALLRAVKNAGYAGPLLLEAPLRRHEAFIEARDLLQLLLDDLARSDAIEEMTEPPAGVREGIRLFNEGRFYEAHEELENEWHAEPRPIRRLYQGILQIGVGFHHARNGNQRGAVLLLTDGIAKTAPFAPACLGLDLARLLAETQPILAAILTAGPNGLNAVDFSTLPTIRPTALVDGAPAPA